MLWTDRRSLIDATYLGRIDSEVSSIAKDDEISVEDKIALSCEEALMDLNSRIEAFSGGFFVGGDISLNHIAAVMNTGTRAQVTQRVLPSQIVVSGINGSTSPLSRWIASHALYSFYRDAMNRGGKDRLKAKMDLYFLEVQKFFTSQLASYGLPVVLNPLACPAAELEGNSGCWNNDNLSQTPNVACTLAEQVTVVVTYCDASSFELYQSAIRKNNAESHPSKQAQLALTTGNALTVDISSLNPPTGEQHPSTWQVCRITPLKATGWNVYVSTAVSNGRLILQNSSPILISTTSYTLPADPLTIGPVVGFGQYEDRRLTMPNIRQRS